MQLICEWPDARRRSWTMRGDLVAQDDREQRAVDLQSTVVVDEAQLPEPVHEVTDAGPRGAHHRGESLLAHLRNDGLRPRVLAEVRQQQKSPRQSLFARIEELVDQVFLDSNVPR